MTTVRLTCIWNDQQAYWLDNRPVSQTLIAHQACQSMLNQEFLRKLAFGWNFHGKVKRKSVIHVGARCPASVRCACTSPCLTSANETNCHSRWWKIKSLHRPSPHKQLRKPRTRDQVHDTASKTGMPSIRLLRRSKLTTRCHRAHTERWFQRLLQHSQASSLGKRMLRVNHENPWWCWYHFYIESAP